MQTPIRLICTDFDGTLHNEFECPPVPRLLEEVIYKLQQSGAKWIINTGRDREGLLLCLNQAHLKIKPDYLIVVEREIHCLQDNEYHEHHEWNEQCYTDQEALFKRLRPHLPEAVSWIRSRFKAQIFEDDYSPFCLVARCNRDADIILDFIEKLFQHEPELTVVRNDIYARFSHKAYNKGTALSEIRRLLNITPEQTFAAGDHFNDLPMLDGQHARWVSAPDNAINEVKALVRKQKGYVSHLPVGHGVAQGLIHFLESFSRSR